MLEFLVIFWPIAGILSMLIGDVVSGEKSIRTYGDLFWILLIGSLGGYLVLMSIIIGLLYIKVKNKKLPWIKD